MISTPQEVCFDGLLSCPSLRLRTCQSQSVSQSVIRQAARGQEGLGLPFHARLRGFVQA